MASTTLHTGLCCRLAGHAGRPVWLRALGPAHPAASWACPCALAGAFLVAGLRPRVAPGLEGTARWTPPPATTGTSVMADPPSHVPVLLELPDPLVPSSARGCRRRRHVLAWRLPARRPAPLPDRHAFVGVDRDPTPLALSARRLRAVPSAAPSSSTPCTTKLPRVLDGSTTRASTACCSTSASRPCSRRGRARLRSRPGCPARHAGWTRPRDDRRRRPQHLRRLPKPRACCASTARRFAVASPTPSCASAAKEPFDSSARLVELIRVDPRAGSAYRGQTRPSAPSRRCASRSTPSSRCSVARCPSAIDALTAAAASS